MSRRRRNVIGFFPRLGWGVLLLIRWIIKNPQPVIALALCFAAGWGFARYIRHTEVFQVRRIVLPANSTLRVPGSLLGKNLWTVDIKELAVKLHAQQPWLKEVRIVRDLPHTIQINPIARMLAAQIKLREWHGVDAEGFILPQGSLTAVDSLTRLTGFNSSSSALTVGTTNKSEQLIATLRVLSKLQRHPALLSRNISEINIANPKQIRFIVGLSTDAHENGKIGNLVEVRCGSESDLETQLDRLRTALRVIDRRGAVVRYVDVRFKEPVLGS